MGSESLKDEEKRDNFCLAKKRKTWWKTNEIRFHFGKGF